MNPVSEKIIQGRKEKRYNQKDFAQLIGVSQPSLIKYERGETDLIPIGTAKKIAAELNISFNELFEIESGRESRSLLLDRIDELESIIRKNEKDLADKDTLIDHFRDKFKDLYLEKIERDFIEYLELVSEIYAANDNFRKGENKAKFDEQLRQEKEYMSERIAEIIGEGVFSEFEVLDILYQNDFNITGIVESGEGVVKKLTEYWREYMDVSPAKVEQFLIWHNKKWDSILKSKKAALRDNSGSSSYDPMK